MLAYLLALLPSFIHVFVRKAFGQKIGNNVRIRIGSVIKCKYIEIQDGTSIGPFCYISADKLHLSSNSSIKPFSFVSANIITIGQYSQISPLSVITGDRTPRSLFKVGDHSRVFPFCWLDSGEGISIGNNVGIGGH